MHKVLEQSSFECFSVLQHINQYSHVPQVVQQLTMDLWPSPLDELLKQACACVKFTHCEHTLATFLLGLAYHICPTRVSAASMGCGVTQNLK